MESDEFGIVKIIVDYQSVELVLGEDGASASLKRKYYI